MLRVEANYCLCQSCVYIDSHWVHIGVFADFGHHVVLKKWILHVTRANYALVLKKIEEHQNSAN